MAFFRLVLYASKVNRITEKLKAEKDAASAISRKEKPKYGWRSKLSHVWINCKRRLRNCFINLYFLRNTSFDRFLYRLRKYGSFENYILKSILGFFGGYVLTYLLFLFLAVQLNVKLSVATLICCFLGCILTIGLAFSQTIRCIVFLTLPQFFSKRGRQALIAYALILTMTGPAKNTLNNMGIMSESLACGQEQLKSAVKQIIDVIKKPFVAIKEALKTVVKAVKEVIKKIKEILIKIKRVIMAIIGVIKSVFQFLGRILNLCNKELGTPFQRCSRVFESAIADCQASLGPFFSWACSIGYLVNAVCYIVKPFDLICMLVDFISNSIIGVVLRSEGNSCAGWTRLVEPSEYSIFTERKIGNRNNRVDFRNVSYENGHCLHEIRNPNLNFSQSEMILTKTYIWKELSGLKSREIKIFIRHVKTMFYVRIKFSHSYHFESKSSKSMREIASSIVGEVKMRTKGIVSVFEFFNCAASLFFIFLISRVIYYRHKFLTKERFDNKFLTKNLVNIDLRRAAMEKETIFPLNHRERKKYITIKSLRLLPTERKQLAEGLGLLMSTALKIGTHMAIDYCLFWIMNLIRKYGKFQSKVQPPNIPTMHIAGEGLLADLLKAVVKSFQPLGISLEIDTVPCLPIPIPPDYDRYVQIASLLVLCLLLTILEPYGLRWRNWILCYYYPKRARERAVWLYNHILRSRSSFLKFARRQLRRKVLGSKKISKVTCLEYLRSKTNNKCLLLFLGSDKQQACLLCGDVFRKSDKETPIRCQRPGCTAMYCKQCFEDLDNVCTVCLSPIDYGDLSDFSEERDSSDEEYAKPPKLKVETEEFDSGMTSDEATGDEDGSTDEYSYDYQESEKVPSILTDFRTGSPRDLERQSSPDYVSMQYFDDEMELYSFKPYGFEDKDEETQFPDDGSSTSEKKTSSDPNETSSVASSFEKDKADHKISTKVQDSQSCLCLDLYAMDDPTSDLLLEELKPTSFTTEQNGGHSDNQPSDVGHLQPILEQTEDEALILFSSDEEEEVKSTFFDSSQEYFVSDIELIRSRTDKESRLDEDSSVETPVKENLMSDSEYSEDDLQRLIGKSETKSNHLESTSRLSESTKVNFKDETDVGSTFSSNGKNTDKRTSISTENEESPKITKFDSNKKEQLQSTELGESTLISFPGTEERHIEFIGLQKKMKKNISPPNSSPHHERTSPIKTYQSTISTKTSKQDFPIHMKQKKSILKGDSGSSILSEMKELQGKVTVPKLNLTSLNKDESKPLTSPSHRLRNKKSTGYDTKSGTTRKVPSDQTRISRKTDRTEKRLKAGANISIFPSNSMKFSRDNPASQEVPCQSSEQEKLHSSVHLLRSESTSFSRREETLLQSHSAKSDLIDFDSSDTSVSPLNLGERSLSSRSTNTNDYHFNDLEAERINSDSMSTDISTTRPSIEDSHSLPKSDKSSSTKKSVRISQTLIDSEGTSDEDKALGDTDASSDLSISVQENILGIPRNGKKRGKIDWKHETELHSELPDDTEAVELKSEEIERSKGPPQEQVDSETNRSSDRKYPEDTHSSHELEDSMEHVGDIDTNTAVHVEKFRHSEKFQIQDDDPRFNETRFGRKCRCCKCKDRLPITHHTPGGDPDRRILLQTGVDSCTQTCVDRLDQSSQIECGNKTIRDSFQGVSSNKSCSVRCKLKEEKGRSSSVSKPEKHCFCSICCQMKSFEDNCQHQKDELGHYSCPNSEKDSCSRKKCSIPRRKTVGTFCKPQTRDQVCYTKTAAVFQCQKFRDNISFRKESDESMSSNNAGYRDRLDLPYQDNEEYKRLVRELEEKLVARNRERVRKTMREFEKCSTRNQNLKKPILYDDSSCGEEPILKKLVHLKAGDEGDKGRVPPPPPWKRSAVKGVNTIETIPKEITPSPHRISPRPPGYYHERDPTHWQMDTGTGEWYRVSDVDICDPYEVYEAESRYSQPLLLSRRRLVERYEEEPECEDCDDLNRRYGHRSNMLFCPRHRLDRFPPRHRKR